MICYDDVAEDDGYYREMTTTILGAAACHDRQLLKPARIIDAVTLMAYYSRQPTSITANAPANTG